MDGCELSTDLSSSITRPPSSAFSAPPRESPPISRVGAAVIRFPNSGILGGRDGVVGKNI